DTDPSGNLTTGFLFPIDQRWLTSDSLSIVTTTADGQMEAKAPFTLVPPGTEVAMTSPLTTSAVAEATSGQATEAVTNTVTKTVASSQPKFENTVILPLIASAGFEGGSGGRRAPSSGSSAVVTQVAVEIDPSGASSINCNNGNAWIRVAIYSDDGFDAT